MATMRIFVNDFEMEVPHGINVSRLLEILEESYTADMVVEINHRYIHTKDFNSTVLADNDHIDIIHLAMGG